MNFSISDAGVTLSPTTARKEKIRAQIRTAIDEDSLSSGCGGEAGRPSMQRPKPFTPGRLIRQLGRRAHSRPASRRPCDLDRILPAIKPRFIPFDAENIEVAVLYADAFFSAGEVRHKAGHVPDGVSPTPKQKAANGWGYVIRMGDGVFYDHGVAPTWFVKLFATRKAYI